MLTFGFSTFTIDFLSAKYFSVTYSKILWESCLILWKLNTKCGQTVNHLYKYREEKGVSMPVFLGGDSY